MTLIRPLLGVRRGALRAVVDAAGLVPVDDPANRDPRHDRARVRMALAANPWLDPARLAAAAAHLAEAEAALAWTADLAWDSRAQIGPDRVTLDAAGLPADLRRRLAARAFAALGGTPDGPALDRALARLAAGGTATLGGVQAHGRRPWSFRRVPRPSTRDV